MYQTILKALLFRRPLRARLFQEIVRRYKLLPYPARIDYSAVERPHYGYCLLHAARLARKLGYDRISAIEFGVAGGHGLLNLEMHAGEVERTTGVGVDIYGFDTGGGLPQPKDYRDLPYHWAEGFYAMDAERLQSRLRRARLVLGDVASTLPSFVANHDPAPIGAVIMDLDFYSSSKDALLLFDLHRLKILPRAFMYFDDIVGTEIELYCDYTGERLAIHEFNAAHSDQKICPAVHLTAQPVTERWHHQIFIYHDFRHADYNRFVSLDNQQKAL
jgi:hypothetical protein